MAYSTLQNMPVEDATLRSEAEMLRRLMRRELATIPISQWGFFYPCHLGVWRFLNAARPELLGELRAFYADEPRFEGTGSTWFCQTLGNREEYVELLERIMYPVANSLTPASTARGFLFEEEVPPLDDAVMRTLASVVLEEADRVALSPSP